MLNDDIDLEAVPDAEVLPSTPEEEHNPPLIYSYGCFPPVANAKMVSEQLFKAKLYQNTLIRIELTRREEYARIRATFCPRLDTLEKEVAQLKTQQKEIRELIKSKRQKEGGIAVGEKKRVKKTKYPELEAQLAAIKVDLEPRYAELKIERMKFNVPIDVARETHEARVDALCVERGFSIKAPNARGPANAEVLAQMLQEPQWYEGWKSIAKADAVALLATKKARLDRGELYTENYKLIEMAVDAAKHKTLKDHTRLGFKSADGTGRIGVQLQKCTTGADLLKGDGSFLRLRDVGPRMTRSKKREPRACTGDKQQALVDIRIGSGEKGEPIWATFPVLLHRPIPPDAVIKWAWILVRRTGRMLQYAFQLTLKLPEGRPHDAGTQGAVALHLAWRQEDPVDPAQTSETALRIGYVVGTDGYKAPVFLPTSEGRNDWGKKPRSVQDLIELADRLRGFSDDIFNEVKDTFERWLGSYAGEKPAWLKYETSTISRWCAHKKLQRLAHWWTFGYEKHVYTNWDTGVKTEIEAAPGILDAETVRKLWAVWGQKQYGKPKGVPWSKWLERRRAADMFASFEHLDAWFKAQGVVDEAQRMVLYLQWWCRKDEHLNQWESNARANGLRWRKSAYQTVMHRLAKRYSVLVVDDMKLTQMVRRAPAEGVDALPKTARRQRVHGAPGELRELAKTRFGKRVIVVDHHTLAATCCRCEAAFDVDPQSLNGRCVNGHVTDRDENAALNMLKRSGFSSTCT